jgi:Ca2+-dependent lipid-binding protein
MNYFVERLWTFVNPDLFIPIIDKLEDVMQASIPNFIHSVRVSDLRQGDNAMRILSIKHLPPSDDDEKADVQREDKEEDEDVTWGHYVVSLFVNIDKNLEIAFAYRAPPMRGSKRSKNAHLTVHFYAGLRNFAAVPVLVWVEVQEAIGTIRMRLQMIQEPPFVKVLILSWFT